MPKPPNFSQNPSPKTGTTQPASSFQSHAAALKVDLAPRTIDTLQVNITKLCNQACVHCHVDSSPRRREMMTDAVLQKVLEILAAHPTIKTLDITGGAPELHPQFRDFVREARSLNKQVWIRHNLTVTLDPHPVTGESMEYLPEFFASTACTLISSLPCYKEDNTDKQRGSGVFQKSIKSLQRLNAIGYGKGDLILNLVYNPVGAHLPPPQATLREDYKAFLSEQFGIVFNDLFTITNMPIHRFKVQLKQTGLLDSYLSLLREAFNPAAAEDVMCKNLLSISHDGTLYDCDFNQVLNQPVLTAKTSIFDFDWNKLSQRNIAFGDHCFGCTAGAGSSCAGSLI